MSLTAAAAAAAVTFACLPVVCPCIPRGNAVHVWTPAYLRCCVLVPAACLAGLQQQNSSCVVYMSLLDCCVVLTHRSMKRCSVSSL